MSACFVVAVIEASDCAQQGLTSARQKHGASGHLQPTIDLRQTAAKIESLAVSTVGCFSPISSIETNLQFKVGSAVDRSSAASYII